MRQSPLEWNFGTLLSSVILILNFVQKIRNHFNQPVTINSGYRCPTHNRNVGGVSNSRHTKGEAADIVVKIVIYHVFSW